MKNNLPTDLELDFNQLQHVENKISNQEHFERNK